MANLFWRVFMSAENIKNGIFYTPKDLAFELTKELPNLFQESRQLSVFDPSCGEGSLLHAVQSVFQKRNQLEVSGCDLFYPQNGYDKEKWGFIHGNFFDVEIDHKFDLIVSNPPYIQFGRIKEKKRKELSQIYSRQLSSRKNSDIWVYFLLKSIEQLKHSGTLAAILPWSFVEAQYSSVLRKWMGVRFKEIKILILKKMHFQGTTKRVLLLWATGYKEKPEKKSISISKSLGVAHSFMDLSEDTWNSQNLFSGTNESSSDILLKAKEFGFITLDSVSKIDIGIVTGANKFFILERELARSKGFSKQSTLPIVTSTRELNSLEYSDRPQKELLRFTPLSKRKREYLDAGIELNIQERSHCRRRIKSGAWYDVRLGKCPDAFFTYRVSKIPFMSLNINGYQCTNSIHRIYFNKDITLDQQKWIAISLLSNIGQLSLESGGRHYGNNILKIEPYALKASLIYMPSKSTSCAKAFTEISEQIIKEEKEKACSLATRFLVEKLNISKNFLNDVNFKLKELRLQRGIK